MSQLVFDWNELAFGDKKPLKQLQASFILAPRQVSVARFKQLVKQYLPKGNIVLGLAKEDYIDGFDGQVQFKTLRARDVQTVIDQVNAAKTAHKIYQLHYFQRDADTVLDKLNFNHVVLVNGSWLYAFHNRSTYYLLTNKHITYDMVSAFASEDEAKAYADQLLPIISDAGVFKDISRSTAHDDTVLIGAADKAANCSFDYSFQTGVVLGSAVGKDKYRFIEYGYNKVVPYETYAMHHGASREQHFSPPNDLNHYDTIHAEVDIILKAQKQHIDLMGTTLFINLLPCPHCARMLSQTDITEFVYRQDHSSGYAVKLLELAGKTVRRLV